MSDGYPNAIRAAQAATAAAHMLLQAASEEDAIPLADVLTALCDSIVQANKIEHRAQDNQLVGAVEKWLEEEGVEFYGQGVLP